MFRFPPHARRPTSQDKLWGFSFQRRKVLLPGVALTRWLSQREVAGWQPLGSGQSRSRQWHEEMELGLGHGTVGGGGRGAPGQEGSVRVERSLSSWGPRSGGDLAPVAYCC